MKRQTIIYILLTFLGLWLSIHLIRIGYHWFDGSLALSMPYILDFVLPVLPLISIGIIFFYRKSIWKKDPEREEWLQLVRELKTQFTHAGQQAKIIDKNDHAVPWNLFLANGEEIQSSAMTELGYVTFGEQLDYQGLTISTWISPTAIAYKIEIDNRQNISFDVINCLMKMFFNKRPSRALNATFIECGLSNLINDVGSEAQNISIMSRILNIATINFGINLPIHTLVVGLENFVDISRSAVLCQKIGGANIFGGFLSDSKDTVETKVNTLFNELIKSLDQARLHALKKQLSPSYSASLLNSTIQLALIQTKMRKFVTAIVQPLPPMRTELEMHSIVFAGAQRTMPISDPLKEVIGKRYLGTSTTLAYGGDGDHAHSVTVENAGLLAQAFHRESFLVNPNARFQLKSRLQRWSVSLGLMGIVVLFGLLLTSNYFAYNRVNNHVKQMFMEYYKSILSIEKNSDFLVELVTHLQPLRKGLAQYQDVNSATFWHFIPIWSMESTYQDFYEYELIQMLEPTLSNYLEKDIFAFHSLNDDVELVNLAGIDTKFHIDHQTHTDDLVMFFSKKLIAGGQILDKFQLDFEATFHDLFKINYVSVSQNKNLVEVTSGDISNGDIANILYKSLMRKPFYAQRVDLYQLLGPHGVEIFAKGADENNYLIPRAYTRAGFMRLFSKNNIPQLQKLIQNYESVVGKISTTEIVAIVRKFSQAYATDYIKHWERFSSTLHLRDINSWSDAQYMMRALSSSTDNPIIFLSELLKNNLDITNASEKSKPKKNIVSSETSPKEPTRTKVSMANRDATASSIRNAFRTFIDSTGVKDEQKSQYDLFVNYAEELLVWLEQAANDVNGTGLFLHKQLKSGDQTNPLSAFYTFVSRSNVDFVKNFGHRLAEKLDRQAMNLVYSYIDSEWKRIIITPYHTVLETSFPFDVYSHDDITLIEFNDLFGPKGAFLTFENTYLSLFQDLNGNYNTRPTFLLHGKMELNPEVQHAFLQFRKISQAMFVNGKAYLDFSIRTKYLDKSLSKVLINSKINLYQYTHGPLVWSNQVWPLVDLRESNLQFLVYKRSRTEINKTYKGLWSWFRFVNGGDAVFDASAGLLEVALKGDHGYSVILQFDSGKHFNPFSLNVFSDFTIPISLFNTGI